MTTPTIRCECLCTEEFCKRDCKTCHAQPVSQEGCECETVLTCRKCGATWSDHIRAAHQSMKEAKAYNPETPFYIGDAYEKTIGSTDHPTEAPEDKEGNGWEEEIDGIGCCYPNSSCQYRENGVDHNVRLTAFIRTLLAQVAEESYERGLKDGKGSVK